MPKTHLPFKERLEAAGQLAVRTRISFDIWWYYEGPTRAEILDAMNVQPEFFRFDSHAHFVAFVVQISALFEVRSDTINLPSLVDESQGEGLNTESVAAAEQRLLSVKSVVPKCILLRSNLFAHRSARIAYDDVFRKANITGDELRDLSDASISILQNLANDAGGYVPHPNEEAVRALTAIIEAVR